MIKLLSHLSHIRLAAPDPEASAAFYEEHVGLRVIHRDETGIYLRAWGDYYQYSVVIEKGETAMSSMAWRTSSNEALDAAAAAVEAAGVIGTWKDKSFGHGRSFTFTGPYGHTMELYWDVEKFQAEPEFASIYPDRPERRSRHAVAPRQLDHITLAASDVDGFAKWYSETLGFRVMAKTNIPQANNLSVFSVLTTNEKSHDLGVLFDSSPVPGRINHYAFWVDTREDLLEAADVLMENGVGIEYGPSIHGIGEQSFLYFRDQSGMRIEVNTGGYRNYVPDWEPKTWTPSQGSSNFYRNGPIPVSMTESFPSAPEPTATEEGIHPATEGHIKAPTR